MIAPSWDQETMAVVADGLTRRFDDFVAVDDVSFAVPVGQIFGFLGPNGAGKTTTIRMLLGILRPSAGSARVLGLDVVRSAQEVRQVVGYVSQRFGLYDDLRARENLEFYAATYGVPRGEVALYEGITPGAVDYSAVVNKIHQSGAQAVIYGGYHPEASKIVAQMRKKAHESRRLAAAADKSAQATRLRSRR